MKLIDDIKQAYKFATVQLLAWLAVISQVWQDSPDLQSLIPPQLMAKYSPYIFLILLTLRVIDFGRHKTS